MTVYVDSMRARYGRLIMCHMIADEPGELLSMASRIDVSHRWLQPGHFDICLTKREKAIAAGAVEISSRQCAAMVARRRVTGELGSPADALQWFREHARRTRSQCEVAA